MPRILKPILLLGAFALLAACSPAAPPSPTAEPTGAGPGPDAAGYPYPVETFEPAYPVETFDEELFEQSVTPHSPPPVVTSETGAMTITLLYPDGERPVRGQLFFAAGTIDVPDLEGAFIPALDTTVDKSGHSDGVGLLVISGIPPGRYALTLMTPLGAILVERAGTTDSIIFEITADEVTELGEVSVFLDAETLEP